LLNLGHVASSIQEWDGYLIDLRDSDRRVWFQASLGSTPPLREFSQKLTVLPPSRFPFSLLLAEYQSRSTDRGYLAINPEPAPGVLNFEITRMIETTHNRLD